MAENPVKVSDLRDSLGATAKEPMVALQLQELAAVEHVKEDFLPRVEELVDRLCNSEDNDLSERAARMGLKVIEDYAKYNQRWNDTLKTLMAILKLRDKQGAAEEKDDPNALSPEQAFLTGAKNGKDSKGKKR